MAKKRVTAASRTAIIIGIAAAAIVLLLLVLTLYERPMSEEEKRAYRESCVATFADRTYAFTTVEQCETAGLLPETLAACAAWVTGETDPCDETPMSDASYTWCLAKASKDPEDCRLLDTDAEYCRAYVSKNPALCDTLDEGRRMVCKATLTNDFTEIRANTAELCGEEFEQAQ